MDYFKKMGVATVLHKPLFPFIFIIALSFSLFFVSTVFSQNLEAQGVEGRCGGVFTCACGDQLNASKTLNASDTVTTGTCTGIGLNITGNNLILDCAGRNIVGDGGSTGDNGLIVLNSRNITVKNCHFIGFGNGTAYNGAISIFNSNNSVFTNVSVITTANTLHAMVISSRSINVTINNTNLTTQGIDAHGLVVETLSKFNYFYNLSVYVSGATDPTADATTGIRLQTGSGFNHFENTTVSAGCDRCIAILLSASSNNTFDTGFAFSARGATITLDSASNNNTFRNLALNETTNSVISTDYISANGGFDNLFLNNTLRTAASAVRLSASEQNYTLRENKFFTESLSPFTLLGTAALNFNHSINPSNKMMPINLSIYYLGPSANGTVIDTKSIGALYIYFSNNHLIKHNDLIYSVETFMQDAKNITVLNNTIKNNRTSLNPLSLLGVNNSFFYNNNISTIPGSLVSVLSMTDSINNLFENNTIIDFGTTNGLTIASASFPRQFNIFKNTTITLTQADSSGLYPDAVLLIDTDNNYFENLTITSKCVACMGITIRSSSNNTFNKATILATDGRGISLELNSVRVNFNNTFKDIGINLTIGEGIGTSVLGGLAANEGTRNKFFNISINTTSGSALAISAGGDGNGTFTDIVIHSYTGTGLNLTSAASFNHTFENIRIQTGGTGIALNYGNHTFKNIFVNSSATTCTTLTGCDIQAILTDKNSFAVFNFTNITIVTPQILALDTGQRFIFTNLTLENNTNSIHYKNLSWNGFSFNLQGNLTLTSNFTRINSTAIPALNQPAILTFRNLSPGVYFAMRDATDAGTYVNCADTICSNRSQVDTTYSFNVTSFSTYIVQTAMRLVPIFTSNTQANNTFINAQTIFVNVSVIIPNPNTETNITFTFGNTTMINKTTYNVTRERNFTFSSLNTNSVYSYNVTITDNASIENTTSTTRFITLDTTNPAPTLTSSQGTSFGEGGTTTLTCSVTDTNPSTLSLKEGTTTLCSASGTTTSCTTDITPSPGTHTYTCEPFDKASNTATTTLTLDISARSSSGGGSSGGGGGGSTRTIVPKSGDTEEKVTLEIKTEDTPVTTVTLEGTTEGSSLSEADVEIKSKSSNEITNKPDTPVYKYFTIEKKNFENNDLKQATIEFHVEENWINQQDKQPEDVALLHLEGENWKQYDAELLRSENGNYYYKSIVPGFSTFAIALKEEQEITQEEQTAPSVAEELTQSPQKKKWTIPVIFLLALTLATTIIYVIKQNKTK